MIRPSSTGLATAFFRLYLLDALATGAQRPAQLLAQVAAERLPFASGAFGRALQSLIEGGHVAPAAAGAVSLTTQGAAERMVERERWSRVVPTVLRMLGQVDARPAPALAETPATYVDGGRQVAEMYLDRVLLAAVRDHVGAARERGAVFALVLATTDVGHSSEATRRAIVHRAIRGFLGGAQTLLGGDVDSYRYGEAGIAALVPIGADASRAVRSDALARMRLEELLASMCGSVRAFAGARWSVRAAAVTWTPDVLTTLTLVRRAEEALAADGSTRSAA